MRVALGANLFAVVGNAPIIPPQGLGFVYRRCPERSAIGERHIVKVMQSASMHPWECQPTIRLSWVNVLEKENGLIGGLLLRLVTQAALARRHRCWLFGVAKAIRCRTRMNRADERQHDHDCRSHRRHY